MRLRSSGFICRSLARMRLRIVVRRTMNRPKLFFPLTCVKPAQAVRRIGEHNLDLPFGGKIAHALQARTLQDRSAIAFIFEDPLFGYFQIVALGELDQRRRLACNSVLLPLLLGRDPSVDRRHSRYRTPLHPPRRPPPASRPEYHIPP